MASIYEKRVKDIMTRDVVSIHADEFVHDALQLMAENRVSALPVVDRRQRCVGMISTSDFVDLTRDLEDDLREWRHADRTSPRWLLERLGESFGEQPIDGLMSEDVAAVGLDTTVPAAAREMLRKSVHRVPVLDQHQRLVGIVSTMDILAALSDDVE
jgi:CBS domain-containing protein